MLELANKLLEKSQVEYCLTFTDLREGKKQAASYTDCDLEDALNYVASIVGNVAIQLAERGCPKVKFAGKLYTVLSEVIDNEYKGVEDK